MFFLSRRVASSACVSLGLSLLGGMALASEPTTGAAPHRITPVGGMFSIEFPGEPTCAPKEELPNCLYEDATEGWILQTSYSTAEVSGSPAEFLKKHLAANAEEGQFRIDHQEATQVGGFPALDYRFESNDGSEYQSVGRLVLIGTQLVDIEVGGDTLPDEDTTDHFLSAFRVENPPATPQALAQPAPEPQRVPAIQASPSVQAVPAALPSLTTQFQASLLKLGVLRYQSLQEKLPGEGMPLNFSVGTTQRTTQRKRDLKRDALVITETDRTPAGKFENRYWVDAKTLLPYRWTSKSPGASMKLEVIVGTLRGERTGANAAKFDAPVGDTPLLFPGAPLELALSTLPLARGFTGNVQVLDVDGLANGKPLSTWRLSVPFAGPVAGLANFKSDVESYKVELIERTEDKEPRKISLWIEREKARRVLQVEALTPASRGGDRSIQMLQAQR